MQEKLMNSPMKYAPYYLLCLFVVLIDHTSKLLVHEYMVPREEIPVFGEWFYLHYLRNAGMAFGMQFEFSYGKLFLSIFRIFATIGIGYYLYNQAKKHAHKGFLICLGLILGGAIGNAIDSIFYGVFLEGNMIPGSITPWFHGRVIDMLYFPLFDVNIPEWFPGSYAGRSFTFFNAIFNIADTSIFLGAVGILIFQKRFFPKQEEENNTNAATDISSTEETSSSSI